MAKLPEYEQEVSNEEFCKWLESVSDRFINSPNPHARYVSGVLISARKRIEKLDEKQNFSRLLETAGK